VHGAASKALTAQVAGMHKLGGVVITTYGALTGKGDKSRMLLQGRRPWDVLVLDEANKVSLREVGRRVWRCCSSAREVHAGFSLAHCCSCRPKGCHSPVVHCCGCGCALRPQPCRQVKNPGTQVAEAAAAVPCLARLLLTGTPIQARICAYRTSLQWGAQHALCR
jgi:SNF2 family DNA or RNA helicase